MRIRSDVEIADSVWPAVERAIRGLPERPRGMDWHTEHMKEVFTGAIIRHTAYELSQAGVRIPDEC
jgi:hypothetical protein